MNRRDDNLTTRLKAANPVPEPPSPETAGATDRRALVERIVALPSAPRRDRNTPRRLGYALALLMAGIAIGALTTAFTMDDSDARPSASAESLSTISTEGMTVPLTTRSVRFLDLVGDPRPGAGGAPPGNPAAPRPTGKALLMAERGAIAFFRIPLADGGSCFYTGRRADDGERYDVGGGACGGGFPTPSHPILDQSPIQADGPGGFLVMRIEGFAADGVKTVAVTDLSGKVVAETAVTQNVYKITAYPPGGVSELRALDEGRNVVYRWSYR